MVRMQMHIDNRANKIYSWIGYRLWGKEEIGTTLFFEPEKPEEWGCH